MYPQKELEVLNSLTTPLIQQLNFQEPGPSKSEIFRNKDKDAEAKEIDRQIAL